MRVADLWPRLSRRLFGAPERSVFALGVGALAILALWWRASGLDPPSLWLDDQWVALIVRRMTFAEFFALRPPTPLGFVAAEKLLAGLSPDPEWPLQLFPLVCSVAQIPLMACLTYAVTGHAVLAFLAAALAVVAPLPIDLAVRVKQYTADGLATTAILLAGVPLLERWTHRRATFFAAGAVAALLFSFPSAFVSVPLLHVALGLEALRRRHGKLVEPSSVAITAGFDLALALAYLVLLRGQSSAAMKEFWDHGFLPLDLPGALGFLAGHGWTAIRGAVPGPLAPALVLLPLGLLDLSLEPRRRGLAVSLLAVYAGLVCASALRIYPLGGERTDSFAHPIAIVLMMCGLRRLVSWLRLQRAFTIPAYGLALLLVLGLGRPSAYPECGDAEVIRLAEQLAQPRDALIVYPPAALGVGYYAGWPIRLIPWRDYAHGFHVIVERPQTLTLEPRDGYWEQPERIEAELTAFLATPRSRIYYLAGGRIHPAPHAMVLRRLAEHGYAIRDHVQAGMAHLLLFVRPST